MPTDSSNSKKKPRQGDDNHTTDQGGMQMQTVPFDEIDAPGAYICNWNGFLLRMPQNGFASSHTPLLNMVGTEPLLVTKISDDPYVTLSKARLIACNGDVDVNF